MITYAMMMPSPMELAVIAVIIMIFFGAGKLPSVFAEVGKGIRLLRGDDQDHE
jgi:TatA/E family protein of Tat protein translocase